MSRVYDRRVKPHIKDIRLMVRAGATVKDVAKQLGISERTLKQYAEQYQELSDALYQVPAGSWQIQAALHKRAVGLKVSEKVSELREHVTPQGEKVQQMVTVRVVEKEQPPDMTAIRLFLENDPSASVQMVPKWSGEDIEKERRRIKRKLETKSHG
ncbi:MAG: transposase [Christensenellales bacterium]|jgi:transposase-like protein